MTVEDAEQASSAIALNFPRAVTQARGSVLMQGFGLWSRSEGLHTYRVAPVPTLNRDYGPAES